MASVGVAAVISGIGYAVGATTAAQAIFAVAAAAAAYVARDVLSEDFDPDSMNEMAGGGIRQNTRSTQAFYPIVYGKVKKGGNDVFIEAVGADNDDLWIVQNLAEGECDSIAQIGGVDQVFLDEKTPSEYGGNVSYWFQSGSSSQTVNSNIHSAIPKYDDNGRYTCRIIWKLTYDRDYFQTVPKRLVLLKGRVLYDFRDDTTAWSDNPVLALYDYVTNSRYGMGHDSSQIDTTSWTDVANYCDTKGWTINLSLSGGDDAIDVMDQICQHFRGSWRWYDGKIYLSYADLNYESSVKTLTDSNIVQGEDGKAMISIGQPSKYGKPDGVTVQYIDPDKGYIADRIQVGESDGVTKELRLLGCSNRQQAADLGVYHLERWQLDRTISGTFRVDTIELEPHDVVTFSSSALSISDQLLRVVDAKFRDDENLDLTLQYEDTDLYNDDYDLETESTYTCDLPDPQIEPPSVSDVTVTEETYNYRGRSFTRLKVSFNDPNNYPWYDHVEVWVSDTDSNYKHQFNSRSNFSIENAEEGSDYWIKLKTVSIFNTKTRDINDYKLHHVVGGYTQAPDSLDELNAIVNSNAVNLYSSKVADSDVEHYEFRLGDSWSGAIFLAALRAPNMSLYGVKPGVHTFWANTYSNNETYGDSPQSASITLPEPPQGWTVQNTETDDYSGGTHDNTEQTTYNTDSYLKCSHGGSSLSLIGTYTSSVFDLGASGQYLVYILADIVVTGAGTTWADVIPDTSAVSTTWDDINIDTRTWTQIFELSEGPKVKMRLLYGETSPPSNTVKKMELLGTLVTGRYFQVEIEIEDPSDSSNTLVENFTLKFCQ